MHKQRPKVLSFPSYLCIIKLSIGHLMLLMMLKTVIVFVTSRCIINKFYQTSCQFVYSDGEEIMG